MGFIRSWQFAAGFASAIGLITGTVVIGSAVADKQAPVADRGASFTCTPAQVWDGDSFTCSDGTKVRVAGIAAREVRWDGRQMFDAGCNDGHPCPSQSGIAARHALAGLFGGARGTGPHGHLLVRGPALRCVSNGSAGRGRVGAWCNSKASGDISCLMVKGGYALRWDQQWRDKQC